MLEIIFSRFRTPTIGVETFVEHSEACGMWWSGHLPYHRKSHLLFELTLAGSCK